MPRIQLPKLTVSSRGVIYILIPALVQLLCLSVLLLLLNEEEAVGHRESQVQEIAARANWICVLVASSVAARLADLEGGIFHEKELYADAAPRMVPEALALRDCVKDEPKFVHVVDKSLVLLRRLEYAMADQPGEDTKQKIDRVIHVSEQTWPDLLLERRFLLRGENQYMSALPKTFATTRHLTKDLLTILILFTVASAVIVIYRFGRTIASRLAITADNTRRLTEGMTLLPPVQGQDEIAQLDRSFHEMADALQKAKQARQEYVSMMSHDIRTPLSSVYGSMELLHEGRAGELSETGMTTVERTLRNLEEVLSMINSMLDFEQLESGMAQLMLEEVSLERLVDRAIESIQDLAAKQNISVTSKLNDVLVVVDMHRTLQVLVNLLGNALKFSPAGSTIEVTAQPQSDSVEVRVTDHGRGIPADKVDQVFDRFKQVERSDSTEKRGAGLGLAICREIIRAQGGNIGVTSTVGEGSTFWFTVKKGQND